MSLLHHVLKKEDGSGPDLMFFCPGCECGHGVWVAPNKSPSGGSWTWNGSMDAPTFAPSILIPEICHSHVTDGKISFLGDSTHALTGQTVPLPDF